MRIQRAGAREAPDDLPPRLPPNPPASCLLSQRLRYRDRSMAKSQFQKHLADRLCVALHELTGADLHWVSLEDICERLNEKHTPAMDAAIKYANDQGLLSCGPLPVHSLMLTHEGVIAVRAKLKPSR